MVDFINSYWDFLGLEVLGICIFVSVFNDNFDGDVVEKGGVLVLLWMCDKDIVRLIFICDLVLCNSFLVFDNFNVIVIVFGVVDVI